MRVSNELAYRTSLSDPHGLDETDPLASRSPSLDVSNQISHRPRTDTPAPSQSEVPSTATILGEAPPPYSPGRSVATQQAAKAAWKAEKQEQSAPLSEAGPSRSPWNPTPHVRSTGLQSFFSSFSSSSTKERNLIKEQVKKLNGELFDIDRLQDKAASELLDLYIDEIASVHQLNRWALSTEEHRHERALILGNRARSALFRSDDSEATQTLKQLREVVHAGESKGDLKSYIGTGRTPALLCIANRCSQSLSILYPATFTSSAIELKSAVVSKFRKAAEANNKTERIKAKDDIFFLLSVASYWKSPGQSFADTQMIPDSATSSSSDTSLHDSLLAFWVLRAHGPWQRSCPEPDVSFVSINETSTARASKDWTTEILLCGLSLKDALYHRKATDEIGLFFWSSPNFIPSWTSARANLLKTLLLCDSLSEYQALTCSQESPQTWITPDHLEDLKGALIDSRTQGAANRLLLQELTKFPSAVRVAVELMFEDAVHDRLDASVVQLIQS